MNTFLVQHYFEKSLSRYNKKICVRDKEIELSFEDVNIFSNKLALCLKRNGAGRQSPIVVSVKRNSYYIGIILGILKNDSIYIPIDKNCPENKVVKILNDCNPPVIICDSTTIKKMRDITAKQFHKIILLSIDKEEKTGDIERNTIISMPEINSEIDTTAVFRNIDTDLAYILYTSGSSGNPKGVGITHLNIINYIEWAVKQFSICDSDRIISTAPFQFDMFTFDIFTSLKSAATLCIAGDVELMFPIKLLDFIEKNKGTIWKGISSLFIYIANTKSLEKGRIPTLKKILFGGEELSSKYLIEWMQKFPDIDFYNVYGPTEATGISTFYHVPTIPNSSQEKIPIGQACANTETYVITEDGDHAKVNEIGELWIRGSSLSPGYISEEDNLNSVFAKNPFSLVQSDRIYKTGDLVKTDEKGRLIFIGRKDDQVKVMGYRIELEEIRRAITSIEGIEDGAVIVYNSPDKDEIKEIIAFYQTLSDLSLEYIITEIKKKIPPYMIPKHIIRIESICRTDRMKIDKNELLKYYIREQKK
ncbi:MAG: amino acid adenylation domain-containing protein [Spirochaetaceae bacterium]|nr:amino acid adenylation domain-containing protein [Spirochaetaceae bacterium]